MGSECAAYHQNLAEKIASKTCDQYTKVLTFTRCKLSFIVLRSALLCLRESRSIASRNLVAIDDKSSSIPGRFFLQIRPSPCVKVRSPGNEDDDKFCFNMIVRNFKATLIFQKF